LCCYACQNLVGFISLSRLHSHLWESRSTSLMFKVGFFWSMCRSSLIWSFRSESALSSILVSIINCLLYFFMPSNDDHTYFSKISLPGFSLVPKTKKLFIFHSIVVLLMSIGGKEGKCESTFLNKSFVFLNT